ncbi:MAG: molybdate ABC transporter permease subunit [Chloroflexota bacterium]|nr:molybdate ABC transporter permease subunit [Chloroflexota bacterium]MDE2936600.1 molybdate ABC transporter permease subunit [Chloroflexota bacterium]MXW28820.1 molybdate ABC transporter permease subunit [Chloroflexota bacterium]MXX65515.1 molybdate ABC transporter permease subunit [Chloroflexota bacterium]MYB17007.1 molybdate ABC transporter permease subunit [Chloroflexota bacterium]
MFGLSPSELDALALTVRISVLATLVSLPPGVLAGYALARWSFPGKGLLNVLVHLPLVLPPVVTGLLLLLLLGSRGPVGGFLEDLGLVLAFRWTGAALAAAVMGFPLMVRAIRLAVESVDPRLEQAGATLGASGPWVFATITFPLILPGVLTGAVLAFARAMGEFGATITFAASIPGETTTLATAIYAFLQAPGGEAAALRLVVISVIVAMLALALSETLSRRVARRISGQ